MAKPRLKANKTAKAVLFAFNLTIFALQKSAMPQL
jgi:hypothetical protein